MQPPKNRINEIAIQIQKKDNIDVGPVWWGQNVSDQGTEQEMLQQFMEAYERDFPRGADGIRRKRQGVS